MYVKKPYYSSLTISYYICFYTIFLQQFNPFLPKNKMLLRNNMKLLQIFNLKLDLYFKMHLIFLVCINPKNGTPTY